MKAIGYGRVSTGEQAESGHGLDAQKRAVLAYCDSRGWEVDWRAETGSGGTMRRRPVLEAAISSLVKGDALIVSKLDRVSRSVNDFVRLVERADKEGWLLVCLDIGVDTSTPNGAFLQHILIGVAELERRLISQRVKAALFEAKVKAGPDGYRKRGRDLSVHPSISSIIRECRSANMTLEAIAHHLNLNEIASPRGGRWHITSVQRVLCAV